MERQEEGTRSDCQVSHAWNKECALQLRRYSTERSNLGSTLQKEACGVQIGTFRMTIQGLLQYLFLRPSFFSLVTFIFQYSNLDHSPSPILILLNSLSMLWKWRKFTTHAHSWYKMEFKWNAHRTSHLCCVDKHCLLSLKLYMLHNKILCSRNGKSGWLSQFQRTRVRAL